MSHPTAPMNAAYPLPYDAAIYAHGAKIEQRIRDTQPANENAARHAAWVHYLIRRYLTDGKGAAA